MTEAAPDLGFGKHRLAVEQGGLYPLAPTVMSLAQLSAEALVSTIHVRRALRSTT